jgi:hypothetical protein
MYRNRSRCPVSRGDGTATPWCPHVRSKFGGRALPTVTLRLPRRFTPCILCEARLDGGFLDPCAYCNPLDCGDRALCHTPLLLLARLFSLSLLFPLNENSWICSGTTCVYEKETALDETDVLAATALAKRVDEDGHAQLSARWW